MTTLRICSKTGEREFYGFASSDSLAFGKPNTLKHPKDTSDRPWCFIHEQYHPSTVVVIEIPFSDDDYNDENGEFDPNWSKRFDELATRKADQLLFEASQDS